MVERLKSAFYNWDIRIFYFMNGRLKCRTLDRIMPALTRLGSASATILVCLVVGILGNSLMETASIEAFIALTTSHIFVQLLKRVVCRERPNRMLPGTNTFNVPLDYYSFPSGHTTAAFSINTVFVFYKPVMVAPLMVFSLIVGLSRLYLGVHYPSDVLIGILIGVAFAIIIHFTISGFIL